MEVLIWARGLTKRFDSFTAVDGIDIEVRRAPECGRYELVLDYPDGREVVERFQQPRRLLDRALAVQARLMDDGWIPAVRGPVPACGPRRRSRLRRVTSQLLERQSRWARRLAACFGF